MALALYGIGVSRGVVVGKVHVLERGQPEVTEYTIPARKVKAEIRRLENALEAARNQLKDVRDRIPASTAPDIAAFIDSHLLMLEDSTLTRVPVEMVSERRCNAEWALKLQRDSLVDAFEAMDDAYLRTRKDDVAHVINRVLRILLNHDQPHEGLSSLKGYVVAADDLTPADTMLLQHQGIIGFVTEYGGPLSHTAIMARSLRIPAVVGARHARLYMRGEEEVILDGSQGVVVADADEPILKHYRKRQRSEKLYRAGLRKLKGEPAVTKDNHTIGLLANIELPADLKSIKQVSAAGVGLYRTEFLFMNRPETPGEEEQLANYVGVLNAVKGKPVTIRTLDLGSDKSSDAAGGGVASNPALGLRAIRLCLKEPALFRPQLRAILRASAYGPVRMMIPMLSNLQELDQVLQLIQETRRELDRDGLEYDSRMPVGGMIEIPAAALSAHLFARRLDFLSVGTNDLIQYTLAIDRIDNDVNYLYDPLNPGVLRLIHLSLRAGTRAGIPVAMCGEMAGDPQYTRLLLGLGLREFSMHPASLLEVKKVVTESSVRDLARPARKLLHCPTAEQARAWLERLNQP